MKPRSMAVAFALVLMTTGCAELGGDHYVVAASATKIGVNMGTDPTTQSTEFLLGYKRGELAVVPTNRARCVKKDDGTLDCQGEQGNGANETAEVLMELNYGGQEGSGVYQRLAVGPKAVSQGGAAVMFARDSKGDTSAEAAQAIQAAMSPQERLKIQGGYVSQIADLVFENTSFNADKLAKLLRCHDPNLSDKDATQQANKFLNMARTDFETEFGLHYGWSAGAIYNASKGCKLG